MSAFIVIVGTAAVLGLFIVGIVSTINYLMNDRLPPPDPPLAPA